MIGMMNGLMIAIFITCVVGAAIVAGRQKSLGDKIVLFLISLIGLHVGVGVLAFILICLMGLLSMIVHG